MGAKNCSNAAPIEREEVRRRVWITLVMASKARAPS